MAVKAIIKKRFRALAQKYADGTRRVNAHFLRQEVNNSLPVGKRKVGEEKFTSAIQRLGYELRDDYVVKTKRKRSSGKNLTGASADTQAEASGEGTRATGQKRAQGQDRAEPGQVNEGNDNEEKEEGGNKEIPWKGIKGQEIKKGPFSAEEKAILERAASQLAEERGYDPSDRSWLLQPSSKRRAEDGGQAAWKELAKALPQRNPKQVFAFGYRRWHPENHKGPWTATEEEILRNHVAQRGRKWAEAGKKIGRLPESCRDKWRSIKKDFSKGKWTEEEVQRLEKLVHEQLERAKGSQPSGRQLDKINWEAISEAHGTRNRYQCLAKWYERLAPSMHSRGEWQDSDDFTLLQALAREASEGKEEWQVDWNGLVRGRPKASSLKRWNQMQRIVPKASDKSLFEKVDFLLDRFGGPELRDYCFGPRHGSTTA